MHNPVFIKRNHQKRLLSGHLWVFSNELLEIPKYALGEIVEVFYEGKSYGFAFYNPNSLITCRLLKTNNSSISDLLYNRISNSKRLRETLLPDTQIYRLVYGESDYLPGLIIDKYNDYFVIQILTFGFEIRKELIKDALLSIFPNTKGIIARGNSKLRNIEGLPNDNEIFYGKIPDSIIIDDKGLKLSISLNNGQKTGYFLDQSQNRQFLRSISNNKSVLDCYSNIGGFGLNSYYGSAREVTFVDVSNLAIENVKINLEYNHFKNYKLYTRDVFELLPELFNQGKKYDIVILDPPAFAKNKKSIYTAEAAYSKLNKYGLKLLDKNGYLITSSCSHYIEERKFIAIVSNEISKSGRNARLIHRGSHSPDHPIHPAMPETEYLKYLVFYIE